MRALLLGHVVRSRAEPGCLQHGVAIDVDDPVQLVFFERWTDRDAIDTHLKLAATRSFVEAVVALVDQPPTLSMFEAAEVSLR